MVEAVRCDPRMHTQNQNKHIPGHPHQRNAETASESPSTRPLDGRMSELLTSVDSDRCDQAHCEPRRYLVEKNKQIMDSSSWVGVVLPRLRDAQHRVQQQLAAILDHVRNVDVLANNALFQHTRPIQAVGEDGAAVSAFIAPCNCLPFASASVAPAARTLRRIITGTSPGTP